MPCIPHRPGSPYEGRPSQSKRTLADVLNLLHGMRHEQNRHVTALDKVLNTGLALLLEEHVADGKHLIDDQDIGLGNGGDCKTMRATIPEEKFLSGMSIKLCSSTNSIMPSKSASINSLV